MVETGPISITLSIDEASTAEMTASLRSLAELAEVLPEFRHSVLDLLEGGGKFFDVVGRSTCGAGELVMAFEPSELFLGLVAAVRTGHREIEIVSQPSHGWPLLSVGTANATVAEGGGVSTLAPGGAA